MKKYWLIGLYALALTSCDSFLNCEPENSFLPKAFWSRNRTYGFIQMVFCKVSCPAKKQ